MKYDCSKTRDCIHEHRRLCGLHSAGCDADCPFFGMDNCNLDSFDEDMIALLQEWSDEHPENLKLTKKEHNFLSTFPYVKGMSVNRTEKGLYFVIHRFIDGEPYAIGIDENMFPFIQNGEEWYFDKLLSLEVEE